MIATSSFCMGLPSLHIRSETILIRKEIPHINLNVVLTYHFQKVFADNKKLITKGKSIPESPIIRKSNSLMPEFIFTNTLGIGRIWNFIIFAPQAKARIEWPISCKKGYIIIAINKPTANSAKDFNISFKVSPILYFHKEYNLLQKLFPYSP